MQSTISDKRNDSLLPLIEKIQSEDTKHYVNTRVLPQMQYYSHSSKKHKSHYRYWMIVSMALSTLLPVLSVLSDGSLFTRVLIAAVASAISGVNAYLSFENSRDLWKNYRTIRESLLSTLYLYLNNAGMFRLIASQDEKDALLVETCEKEISQESTKWIEMFQNTT